MNEICAFIVISALCAAIVFGKKLILRCFFGKKQGGSKND